MNPVERMKRERRMAFILTAVFITVAALVRFGCARVYAPSNAVSAVKGSMGYEQRTR